MTKHTNFLAGIFDWLGEALERFNPSAFRFLAAVLPYLTPIPVAWLTADSSSTFLNFPPRVSFVFVFALEGIGLWFTTMLVDSVVDWVRSKNWKSFVPVLLFAFTVIAYVFILVNLNVTLEEAVGNPNPALSRVITLLCFLPLITGIGNGYYKLKLEYKTETELAKEKAAELAERIREENRTDRMEKYRIRHGSPNTDRTVHRTKVRKQSFGGKSEQIRSFVRQIQNTEHRTPRVTEIANEVHVAKSYASETLQAILLEDKNRVN